MSYYYHAIPGRLRIKTPLVKNNERQARHIEKFLSQIRGVVSIVTSTLTGSITINYNPKVTDQKILLEILQKRGIFDRLKGYDERSVYPFHCFKGRPHRL
jgi:hypothetical protein